MRKRRAGFGGEDSGPPPMEFFKVTHSLNSARGAFRTAVMPPSTLASAGDPKSHSSGAVRSHLLELDE